MPTRYAIRQHQAQLREPLCTDPKLARGNLECGGAAVSLESCKACTPRAARSVALRGGDEAERHERIVKLVGIAHVRPGFCAHALDRLVVELAELRRLLDAHVAARLHGERAAFLGRRIVEERVRFRTQDLLR